MPGCGTGSNYEIDIEEAARYCLEVAKAYTEKRCQLYDEEKFKRIVKLYGRMNFLQTPGDI